MGSDELAVEQPGPGKAQRHHQPGQRHLGRVGHAAEHAFAAEYPGEADPVKPTNQRIAFPAFDRMGMAQPVEVLVAGGDSPADPAFGMAGARRGAGGHYLGEGRVAGDAELVLRQHLGERARAVEMVERQDRPLLRLDPEDIGIIARIRHREYPAAIGGQQQFGRNDRWGSRLHAPPITACAGDGEQKRAPSSLPSPCLAYRGANAPAGV